jgi:hypothetical protein
MTDDEFNQFITLLDAACASEDQKIKKALKKFMFLVRLNITDDEMEPGPFTKLMETIDSLQRRVSQLENAGNNTFTTTDIKDWGTTTTPQWIYQPTYTTGGTYTVPNTSSTNITLTGGSSTTNTTLSSGSSCTGFTTTGTSSYIINADDSAPKGTEIKEAIKSKLDDLLA